jgi:hypothetical protein
MIVFTRFLKVPLIGLLIFTTSPPSFAWFDKTHLAIAKTAGYENWYSAIGADMAKLKAGDIEKHNHYYNNEEGLKITPQLVLAQAEKYDNPEDKEGHLCGAIVASLRDYQKASVRGKYAEYPLGFCAHYVGDLSQPLHNIPYDSFNRDHHRANDGIIDTNIFDNEKKIRAKIYRITLRPASFESDLAKEIARIATLSHDLGIRLKQENRDMTEDEAYTQVGHSVSLFRAILEFLGRAKRNTPGVKVD